MAGAADRRFRLRAAAAMTKFRKELKASRGITIYEVGETLHVLPPPKMTVAESKALRNARKRLAKKKRREANRIEIAREEAHMLRVAMGESMDENAPA